MPYSNTADVSCRGLVRAGVRRLHQPNEVPGRILDEHGAQSVLHDRRDVTGARGDRSFDRLETRERRVEVAHDDLHQLRAWVLDLQVEPFPAGSGDFDDLDSACDARRTADLYEEEKAVLRMLVEGMLVLAEQHMPRESTYPQELFDYALSVGVLRPNEIIGPPK